MSEVALQWVQGLKLLIIVAGAVLYGFGGISGKWKRRMIAPAVLTLGILGIGAWIGNFSWWFALWFLGLFAAFTLGYGVNSSLMGILGSKVAVRAVVGLLVSLAALAIAIPMAAWLMLGFHVVLMVATSAVLGAFNPTKSARAEETTIGFVAGFIPIMTMI